MDPAAPSTEREHVVIRMFEPEEHFTRSLVIPQVKLKDWEAQ
jgi:hypothetical protein